MTGPVLARASESRVNTTKSHGHSDRMEKKRSPRTSRMLLKSGMRAAIGTMVAKDSGMTTTPMDGAHRRTSSGCKTHQNFYQTSCRDGTC